MLNYQRVSVDFSTSSDLNHLLVVATLEPRPMAVVLLGSSFQGREPGQICCETWQAIHDQGLDRVSQTIKPYENHKKTTGKPQENHMKIIETHRKNANFTEQT